MSSMPLIWQKMRRFLLVFFVVGGTLFQTSCSTLATEIAAGALSSVTNTYITNAVYEWLGLGGSLYGMGSF